MLERVTIDGAVAAWFREKGWTPFDFQKDVWARMAAGESGLLHATTGTGKTLAVALGAWQALRSESPRGLMVLWVTPMRALAADTTRALTEALAGVQGREKSAPQWSLGLRTGDTSSSQRASQSRKPPTLLVTTPESLSLLLSRENARDFFADLRCVVVDEWHELIGNKRGVQTQLALARLRRWRPELLTWGMSATLGDLHAAKRALLGPRGEGALVEARLKKKLAIDTLIPATPERFPWAGHLGAKMAEQAIAEIDAHNSTLLFTNTRSQAELWRQRLLRLRPDWADLVAIHHGSLAQEERDAVERGLKEGALKAVVCTSSLDLGVDFLPVERVLQIGSPKGVARLLQRAGRSGHAPGRASRVTLVPSHSLELVESAAVQSAIRKGHIESRASPVAPLDVLAQHLVTIGLGGGFTPDALLAEVRETVAYENLSGESWGWCLDFVRQGGPTLRAYPDFRRVTPGPDGVWRVADKRLALRHRLNIGAIVSDASVMVQYFPRGRKLGTVEESFVARMKPGDKFWFAGRLLELVNVRDLTAFVKKGAGSGATPRWMGGRMPLSTTLADEMVETLARAAEGNFSSLEMQAAKPFLQLQQRWSALPTPRTLLAETLKSREGWHLFLYPFAGRNAHLGLASLIAWRAAQMAPGTFSIAVNDYGFELLSGAPRDWASDLPRLIEAHSLDATRDEVIESLNAAELARRRFRDIAQIAGLVVNLYPGERKSARQLQASSSLFYDVFRKYDPENGLLKQAERELLEDELDVKRLHAALTRMNKRRLAHMQLKRCSPLAFPLIAERFRESLSNESFNARIERMLAQLNAAADA
ncbi:ligase-associated DNA damage response DEXH box helicase [Methylocystis parvus]|uniref:Ligase-associated DNA damage response DEXH box helicase n=1 Tax=Methylocystis parvus TaxID=134 RepID=A0A6B8M4A1_9HYPH|nr:ligase-associated DNA damage response DEXH box helicase [Methylocystis parvus]QGM96579.1 ligase-associated DNA damage response DEXH box helicase [Methylocystis parvus]WBJ99567.1 ligase-associated DNA damage response DEXH box helicase [Methylocystis parvus OBBP]